jgi:magnesium transporter
VEGEVQIFFRDVYDHLVRIEDMNQIVRDRTDNALSTYLSSVANRQNETMRVLSIVATIFLPLTLIAGIYGMNFEYMPELTWKWSYFVVLGVMVIGILTIIWRFWARGWLAWGRGKVSRARKLAVDPERLIGYLGQAISITRQHRH